MVPIIFYYDDLSQPCRALEIFLRVHSIPHVKREIRLSEGAQFGEEFVKINPFKKVPVIDDEGFILAESVAILRYLCRKHKIDDHWYPKKSKDQARVDEYLEWQHIGTRAPCAIYVLQKVFTPMLKGVPPNPDKLAKTLVKVNETCDNINDVWLKNGKQFVCGSKISIADLLAAAELEELRLTDFDPCKGRPRLREWMERVKNVTKPHYENVHARLYKIAASFKDHTSKL